VGKGKGRRINDHEKEARKLLGSKKRNLKIKVIHKLWKNGLSVIKIKFAENLTEQEALDLEMELIALYGRRSNGTGILCNLTDGGEGPSGFSEKYKEPRTCLECGKKFLIVHYQEKKYCSSECFYKACSVIRRKPDRPCAQCGNPFHSKNPKKIYCSPECYHLSQVGQKRSDETKNKQSLAAKERKGDSGFKKKNFFEEKPCELCGKPFMPRNINENNKRKYCSTDCQHKAKVGSTHTEETKQKLRKPKSEEHKKKQSETMTGRKRTKESIEKGKATVARNKAEKEKQSQQFSLNLDKVSNG